MTTHRREPLGKVHTKIVATVGPASREPATLRALIEAGVDVFRLNFSHGTHDEHSETLRRDPRRRPTTAGRIVAVLQDLGGPEDPARRRSRATPSSATSATSSAGQGPRLRRPPPAHLHLPRPARRPQAGRRRLLRRRRRGDGRDRVPGAAGARMQVTLAGRVRSHQGLNLPGRVAERQGADGEGPRTTSTGRPTHEVDYVGLSFVRQASDVLQLRRELEQRGRAAVKIVAKIEKPQAVENLDAIIAEADAVMVARGRPRGRDGRGAGAGDPEAGDRRVPPGAGAGDHRHADAQQHGDLEPADPRRGDRRLQRRARRHRRRDALGRDGRSACTRSRRSRR